MGLKTFCTILFSIFFLVGCLEPKVEQIHYGHDYCDHCKMQITDKRYGGAILTKQGRTLKFDSVECLAESKTSANEDVNEIYFVDFETSQLTPQGKIQLFKNENMHGPMGTLIQAYSREMSLPKTRLNKVK